MAKNSIKIDIKGIKEMKRLLRRAGKQMPMVLGGALFRFAEEQIASPAKNTYVPVVTGALKSSINTQLPVKLGRDIVVKIVAGGAAAPYALAVHENPRSGKTGGLSPSGKKYGPRPGQTRTFSTVGGFKYLETPAMIAASNPGPLINDIREEVEALYRGSR